MDSNLTYKILALAVIVYITPLNSFAQYFKGPIASSYGNAGRAATESSESLFLNPATLVYTKISDIALFYHDGYIGKEKHDKLLGLSIVDHHKGSYFPGALSYINRRRTFGNGLPGVDEELWQLSAAKSYKKFSVGLSIYRLEQNQDFDTTKFIQWSGNLGLLYNHNSKLQLGLTYNNAHRDKDSRLPQHLEMLPTWGIGSQYKVNDFIKLRTDLSYSSYYNPDDKFNFHFGFESLVANFNAIRLGVSKNGPEKSDTYSLGWSFLGPRFSLNYTVQQDSKESKALMHFLSLTSATF